MIQLPRKHSRKQILLITMTVMFILCIIGVGAYAFYKTQSTPPLAEKPQPATPPTLPKPTDRLHVEPHDQDPGAQQRGVDNIHTSDESAGAAAFPTTQPNLTVEISDIRQTNSRLTAITTITPKAEGTCSTELTQLNGVSRTKKSSLSIIGNIASCSDATLDTSNLPRGEWTLTVKVQVNSNVATATKTVTLK